MAAVLAPADASRLMASAPSSLRRRVIAWAIFVIGIASLIPLVAFDSTSCSEEHPCGPTPIYAAASGVYIVSWFLAFIRPWAAAAAAGIAALTVALQGHGAIELVIGGYAVVAIVLAWLAARRPDSSAWVGQAAYGRPVVPEGGGRAQARSLASPWGWGRSCC